MTGEADYERAFEKLISQGVKIAAVTLGKNGAYVRTAEGGTLVNGFKNKAIDATGAGDVSGEDFCTALQKAEKLRRNSCNA
ncbi:MAG: PfkB family carbohydrate kinase [Huintestinicola sp.]|uniref:PfkB family carbohydrate kinase n=1 Tax=Huintestinicola sp. TaxID=2981661 RepID=UPI003F0EB39F